MDRLIIPKLWGQEQYANQTTVHFQHHPATITVTIEMKTFYWWKVPVSLRTDWMGQPGLWHLLLFYIIFFFPTAPVWACSSLTFVMYSDVAQVIDCTSVRRSKHVLPVILLLITMNKWLPCTILCLKDDSQKCDWLFKYNFIVWQDRKTEISCGWIHFCLMQVSVCRNF